MLYTVYYFCVFHVWKRNNCNSSGVTDKIQEKSKGNFNFRGEFCDGVFLELNPAFHMESKIYPLTDLN